MPSMWILPLNIRDMQFSLRQTIIIKNIVGTRLESGYKRYDDGIVINLCAT